MSAWCLYYPIIFVDCHASAVRLASGRDEWESAALHNANTRCNGLLPMWGPEVCIIPLLFLCRQLWVRACVLQSRGPVYNSQQITGVSGSAYDLNAPEPQQYTVCRPILIWKIKQVTSSFLIMYQKVSGWDYKLGWVVYLVNNRYSWAVILHSKPDEDLWKEIFMPHSWMWLNGFHLQCGNQFFHTSFRKKISIQ